MLVGFVLYHFNRIDINQLPAILFVSVVSMAYNFAKDSDKDRYAFSWSVMLCIGIFMLAAFMVTTYSPIFGFISLIFIFLNFADSNEYKEGRKEVAEKEIENVPEIKTYNIKDITRAKNSLLKIESDSKGMTVEIVVPQNITYFKQAIEDLTNERIDFDSFISWVKFVNNNCYAVWVIIENDTDRIDTIECVQRIMSITTQLLNKYGGDCFVKSK